jgi:hypothetical protein
MQEQMLHLVLTSSLSHCSIRVMLESAGNYGAVGGAFMLMDYAAFSPAVYAETYTAGLFVEEPQDVAIYCEILARLDSDALKGAQSTEWLAELASDFDRVEECPR